MKRIYNPLYIGIIGYFCLLLPGFILFAQNFERLEKANYKKPVLIIGSLVFLAMVFGWIFLPPSFDTALQIAHLVIPIGMALWQYPIYRQQIDQSDDVEVQSLLKPALLSIVFALLLISLGITWNWWKHEQLKVQMQEALSAYNDGDLNRSVVLLKEIIETNPGEGLAYTNLAITYESLGYRDSAIAVTEAWLKIMPEDSEAKERLYQLRYQREGSE